MEIFQFSKLVKSKDMVSWTLVTQETSIVLELSYLVKVKHLHLSQVSSGGWTSPNRLWARLEHNYNLLSKCYKIRGAHTWRGREKNHRKGLLKIIQYIRPPTYAMVMTHRHLRKSDVTQIENTEVLLHMRKFAIKRRDHLKALIGHRQVERRMYLTCQWTARRI